MGKKASPKLVPQYHNPSLTASYPSRIKNSTYVENATPLEVNSDQSSLYKTVYFEFNFSIRVTPKRSLGKTFGNSFNTEVD